MSALGEPVYDGLPGARERRGGWLRVAGYAALVGLAGVVLVARTVRAQLDESALALGRGLAGFEQLTLGAHRVQLNGESVHVVARNTAQPVQALLERFSIDCRQATLELLHEFAVENEPGANRRAPRRFQPSLGLSAGAYAPLLYQVRENEGVVACLACSGGSPGPPLVQRLRRLLATSDLSEVGQLRYLYARRTPAGGSFVVLAWTEGSFRLASLMAPAGKDAPGQDLPNTPRPAGSVRRLTAKLQGEPYALVAYGSPEPPGQALLNFERRLLRDGWQVPAGLGYVATAGRSYRRHDAHLLVVAATAPSGSWLALIRTASP